MGHIATARQRAPLRTAQEAEQKQATITEDDVRLRAYEIYLKRGTDPGDEVSDWLQAERELRAE